MLISLTRCLPEFPKLTENRTTNSNAHQIYLVTSYACNLTLSVGYHDVPLNHYSMTTEETHYILLFYLILFLYYILVSLIG